MKSNDQSITKKIVEQSTNWDCETKYALKAVARGVELLSQRPKQLQVKVKDSPKQLVTELDILVEKEITQILKDTRHPIVGEESYSQAKHSPLPKGPFWVIDPIDGTTNFIRNIPLYAVSVGLMDKDFLAGAISLPAFNELYFTFDGMSHLNGRTLQTEDKPLPDSLIIGCFSAETTEEPGAAQEYSLFGQLNDLSLGCLRLGSAASALCYLASGRVQAVVGFGNEIWDVAAGLAIVKQAGCEVLFSRKNGSTKIDYIAGCRSAVTQLEKITKFSPSTPYPV